MRPMNLSAARRWRRRGFAEVEEAVDLLNELRSRSRIGEEVSNVRQELIPHGIEIVDEGEDFRILIRSLDRVRDTTPARDL